jgi:hypothetical protein
MSVVVTQNEVFTQTPPQSLPDATYNPQLGGKSGEAVITELHGKFYTSAYRKILYSANVTAVTVPHIASTMVSVFSLYNPLTSTVNLELVDFDYATVLATTVVDAVGLYWQGSPTAQLATFTTIGVLGTNYFGANPTSAAGQGQFYSALTHSGTPVRIKILGTYGAVTTTGNTPCHYDFDGKVILPPGSVVSVAMSTAASTASGMDLGITWAEYPI